MRQLKRPGRARAGRQRSFVAFGVSIEVAVPDPALWSALAWLLPPGAVEGAAGGVQPLRFSLESSSRGLWTLRVGGEPWIEHVNRDVALTALDQQIRLHVAAHAPEAVFVHAGVVVLAGRALVLPGESFSGKTTLVAALVAAGASYYSDEYAVLDRRGRVHPYARPLSIRTVDGTRLRPPPPAPPSAPEDSVGSGARLALVVLTRYRPGATWRPEPRSPGAGVVSLMANTVPARQRPQETLEVLNAAAAESQVLASDRGEAAVVAPQLLAALSHA